MTEKRPNRASGWRQFLSRAASAGLDATAFSFWRRRGVFVLSALEDADYPDGSGERGPQWHISVSRRPADGPATVRASDQDVREALACFGLAGAEEDNHHPGVARHLWMPVDPKRRTDCECKATEVQVVEPDGYRWSNDPEECRGCIFEKMIGQPCPVHGARP